MLVKPSLLIGTLLIIFLASCQLDTSHDGHDHSAMSSDTTSTAVPDTIPGSPARTAMADVGESHVHMEYHSPAVRGRIIWGGLVPYGQVWVTGAHNATSIHFSKDVIIADTKIPAGKYAFFTIPGQDEWILILNKNWDQHLADNYSQAEDILRLTVKPEVIEHTERLRYDVTETGKQSGRVTMSWEKVRVGFDFNL